MSGFRRRLFCCCRSKRRYNYDTYYDSEDYDSESDDDRREKTKNWYNMIQTQPMELFKKQAGKTRTVNVDGIERSLICPVYPTIVVRQQDIANETLPFRHMTDEKLNNHHRGRDYHLYEETSLQPRTEYDLKNIPRGYHRNRQH